MIERINLTHLACDDVDEFELLWDGWDHSILQLSAGNFGFKARTVEIPGMRIHWLRHAQSVRAEEAFSAQQISFSTVLDAGDFFRFDGRNLRPTDLVVQRPGQVNEFAFGERVYALAVDVDEVLVKDCGWQDPDRNTIAIPLDKKIRYVACCRALTALVGQAVDPDVIIGLRDELLALIGQLIRQSAGNSREPPEPAGPPRSSVIVKSFERIVSALPVDQPVSIPDLANRIEIPERTLYRAFDDWIGIGPARYVELKRLHAVRRLLRASDGSNRFRISEIAAMFGFSNPGRMSRRYQDLFRETPSHTARRARATNG